MWTGDTGLNADCYVAFRGTFELDRARQVEIRSVASGWFTAWLDGQWLTEGPARFHKDHPQYDALTIELGPGRHVIAVQAHHLGVTTRILVDMPPFVSVAVMDGEGEVPVAWTCQPLAGYESQVRRINPQLGWIEWCDTRKLPIDWQRLEFDDGRWDPVVPAGPAAESLTPTGTAIPQRLVHTLSPVASGLLSESFGYERDDIPARFFLRDLSCEGCPAQGVWRRYDLGRVRLGRPQFLLCAPEGSVVQFAYCEHLEHGRVSPYITLSGGASCNLDHYVARGGEQWFGPITPKGARFMEIHVMADPGAVQFTDEQFWERSYHGETEGAFACDDPDLNQIWTIGVETYRACTEDAIIDNPTRERGQWTGDAVSAGLHNASVAYSDLRLFRRALEQAALCARDDGLVSGMSPGGDIFLSTYAIQWFSGVVDYYRLTGDRELLEQLLPAARANFRALRAATDADGLRDDLAVPFIDWGYDRGDGPVNGANNLHYRLGLKALASWCDLVGDDSLAVEARAMEQQITRVLGAWFGTMLRGPDSWPGIGYHAAVLGLAQDFVPEARQEECLGYIKKHILDCFPNRQDAPRNSAPDVASRQLITPYFAHYALPVLIEHGQMAFVLDQYRVCWGYAMAEGRTTWLEVFDPRWSHCHQWSGCPTWQLSRYVLGLWPRCDLGARHFEFRFEPGNLTHARGRLPLPGEGKTIAVEWRRTGTSIEYRIESPCTVDVQGLKTQNMSGTPVGVSGTYHVTLSETDFGFRP